MNATSDACSSNTTTTAGAQACDLILSRSGMRLRVEPGESMTDVLMLAGVHVEMLCEQGVCGTCATTYTDGQPLHRDSCLSANEQRTQVALCCAASASPTLTLDL